MEIFKKYGISRGLFGKVITFYVDQSARFSVFPDISIFLPHFWGVQAFQIYNISLDVHHEKVQVQMIPGRGFEKIIEMHEKESFGQNV